MCFGITTHLIILQAAALVGAIIGGVAGSWTASKFGRRMCLVLNSAPFAAGYFIILFSYLITSNAALFKSILIVGRFITGVGLGWAHLIVPVSSYNAQLAAESDEAALQYVCLVAMYI